MARIFLIPPIAPFPVFALIYRRCKWDDVHQLQKPRNLSPES